MTASEQMIAANQYEQLWTSLMPGFAPPGMEQFVFWAGRYIDDLVCRGINRAAGKRRKMRDTPHPMTLDGAVMYASSVMKNEWLGLRRH
jgi:hypothetical protein